MSKVRPFAQFFYFQYHFYKYVLFNWIFSLVSMLHICWYQSSFSCHKLSAFGIDTFLAISADVDNVQLQTIANPVFLFALTWKDQLVFILKIFCTVLEIKETYCYMPLSVENALNFLHNLRYFVFLMFAKCWHSSNQ